MSIIIRYSVQCGICITGLEYKSCFELKNILYISCSLGQLWISLGNIVGKKMTMLFIVLQHCPYSRVHGANMGHTWVLSAPDGPHIGPMNLAIRVYKLPWTSCCWSPLPVACRRGCWCPAVCKIHWTIGGFCDNPQMLAGINLYPSGAETRIFTANKVNTMSDDGLVPFITRPSAAMVLIM